MGIVIQDIARAVEAAFQHTRQSAAAISILYARGAATCQDVKSYNLLALSIYNAQKTMIEGLREAGVDTLGLTTPPTPTLFYWNNIAGQDAAVVKCPSGLAGFGAPSARFLAPGSIRIETSDPNWRNPMPSATPQALATGEFGFAPPVVIVILLWGIGLTLALGIVYAVAEAWKAREIRQTFADQMEIKAKSATTMWAARAGYIASCKGDADTCAANAIRLYPVPDLSAKDLSTDDGLGVLGWVGVLALAGIGGVILWKKYERDGHILPRRS